MEPAAEVIGIDHIYLTVSSVERAERFYDPDGLRLEITNFRAERKARLVDWDSGS